ncbi:hypothetical protein RMAECT_1053 [Rickettsia rhipicephali str. Ect]|uniref:Uncharacterized protein n=1 Tax=Rickettsia rhipicephali str. Ect TaxID=1359199 RepID=A0A0F3PGQ0_RICRH|nr:hypothetical protein RMAECT_1053 [Rickettsia rhipicephali str. Ect]
MITTNMINNIFKLLHGSYNVIPAKGLPTWLENSHREEMA